MCDDCSSESIYYARYAADDVEMSMSDSCTIMRLLFLLHVLVDCYYSSSSLFHLLAYTDPYVKVNLFHRSKRVAKWRSPVKKHTLVPVFNEPFQFDVFGLETTELAMDVIVMEYDRFSHDQVVGVVHLGSNVTEDMGRTHWDEMIATPNNAISRWHSIIPVNGSGEGGSHSKSRLTSSSSS